MKQGATLSDNKTVSKLHKQYCILQFKIATMRDQQKIIMHELITLDMKES